MNKILFIFVLSLIAAGNARSQQKQYFNNPVIHGDMADPSMIRIGDTYYATATSSEWAPFYPVFTSKDLVNWQQTGHIFNKQPEWTSSSFWAPELYHHSNGKVYCYYTARRKSDNVSYIGVATAPNPTDEFTDHGLLVEFGTEAIDAFVFEDKGQLYITWKAYGLDKRPIEIVGSKLSADGLSLEGEPFSLLKDDENIGMEGQYHFKKDNYYYLIYSAHGCCGPFSNYDVYVARSENFKGPYEKYSGNPILYGDGGDYTSIGHGTPITTPDGRVYYMCHAYLSGADVYMGRQHVIQEMYIGDDNWPHFTTGNIGRRKQVMPFEGTVQNKVPDFEDKFDSEKLNVSWTWNYIYADIKTNIKDNKLILSGMPKGDNRYGTALCLRPSTPHYVYETTVANPNPSLKGLTMYADNNNLVIWGAADNKLILKSVRDGKEEIIYETGLNSTTANLRIEVKDGCHLNFFENNDGKDWVKVNREAIDFGGLVRWDRVARPGLIHVGDYNQPAEFSYFKLTNLH